MLTSYVNEKEHIGEKETVCVYVIRMTKGNVFIVIRCGCGRFSWEKKFELDCSLNGFKVVICVRRPLGEIFQKKVSKNDTWGR